jgi:hypothetical protein
MVSGRLACVVAVIVWLGVPAALAQAPRQPPPAQPAPAPQPAPPALVAELEHALAQAVAAFEAMDVERVLANVSERYRTGPLTKPALRQQLVAMFAAHETLRARVRIDQVELIGDRAWVYSTGEVTGRIRFLGTDVSVLAWQRAPEVAWREGGRWRLIGDQQP